MKYKIKLIMSDEMYIDADSVDDAKQIAMDKFGCRYYIDDVKVTKQYHNDYDNLLNEIEKLKNEKKNAELDLLHITEKKLASVESEIKTFGLLNDWKYLKKVCNEIGVRLCPYTSYDEEPKCKTLMREFDLYDDNGCFGDAYFMFRNWNNEIRWISRGKAVYCNDLETVEHKIGILQNFQRLYDEYKEIQMNRVKNKIQKLKDQVRETQMKI